MSPRPRLALAIGLVAALAFGTTVSAAAPPASQDATASGGVLDTSSAIVVLKADPLATYDGKIRGYERTRPDRGKLNPNSAAAKKYLGYLKFQHSEFQRWLQRNVPSAKITSEYFTVLNAVAVTLNGVAIGRLRENADVVAVEYNALYRPNMSESYKLINAEGAWAAAGVRSVAGTGVKVGIIDTGIDQTHEFFDPTAFSYPDATFPRCDAADSATGQANSNCEYVTAKVIVAKVFYNKAAVQGLDAEALQEHGSHVAGTVAGVTGKTAVVQSVSIGDLSGVAPGAWLGNYNVFPGGLLNSRSEDILNAVEAAVGDGMDVLNLSLGGGYRGTNDLLAKGLDAAVDAGVVVAVAAGNSGPGPFTVESPGRARNVITVGASTNQHFVGQPITYPSGVGTTIGASVGEFDALVAASYDLFDTNSTSCTSVSSGASGKLAVINRGACTFSTKVRNATAAGALGVVVVNNVAGDPVAMAKDGLGGDTLPAVMIGKADGSALRLSGETTASAVASFAEFVTANGDILAGFSSQGPTFVDEAIKPDLTSVGVNVLSSIPGSDWAFFQGTSMATPHIAGSAAVLLDIHPSWSPAQVKSALVNTADLVVKNAFNAATTVGPMAQGGGREDLTEASETDVLFWPVAANFGRIDASRVNPTTMAITVSNLTGSPRTFDVVEARFVPFTPTSGPGSIPRAFGAGTIDGDDIRVTTPTTITVGASSTATLNVTVNAGLPNGTIVQGWISLTGGGDEYQFAYWAEVAP